MTIQARTQPVHIYQGDDLAEMAFLRQDADLKRRRYDEAKRSGTLRGGGDTEAKDAEDKYDQFVAEAAERATTVTIRALGRRQWRSLLDAHRPRYETRMVDGAEQEVMLADDVEYGVNTATFPEALLTYRSPERAEMRTIVEPTFADSTECLAFLDDLSGGDFDRLWIAAYYLNGSLGGDPKATTYSSGSLTSEPTST